MPLANRRSGAVAPVPVSAPPSNSQMKARPEPLCSPKARIAPVPLVWSRAPSALYGPYSTAGSSLSVPSAAANAPFGDDRGGEIEHNRILPLPRNADAIRRGRQPLLDAPIRRDQQRAGGVD